MSDELWEELDDEELDESELDESELDGSFKFPLKFQWFIEIQIVY